MLSVFFLDFFDDFLGVSETEPDGESSETPSLLQEGNIEQWNSIRVNAYLTCKRSEQEEKLAYELYCYRPARPNWHAFFFSWIIYVVIGKLQELCKKNGCISKKSVTLKYCDKRTKLNLPICWGDRSSRGCPLCCLGHAVDKQKHTLCIQL